MNFEEEAFYRAMLKGHTRTFQWSLLYPDDILMNGDEVQFDHEVEIWSQVAPFFHGKRKEFYFPTARVRRFSEQPKPPQSPHPLEYRS